MREKFIYTTLGLGVITPFVVLTSMFCPTILMAYVYLSQIYIMYNIGKYVANFIKNR